MELGILMSGQGAQQVGMGDDLYQNIPVYRQTLDEASAILGYDLQHDVCDDEHKIKMTAYAQPAILAMSMGIYRALSDVMPKPAAALGLSLGEYSALTAAGVFDFDQSISLIKDRGAYMQEAGDKHPGKMVAVMSDEQDKVVNILESLQAQGKQVYPANFNTFNQLVIGGVETDVIEAMDALSEEGISRMIPLAVSGAFHTPLLDEAGVRLTARLSDENVKTAEFDVYSNTTGQIFADTKQTLLKQIVSPTYFAQALQAMADQGIDTLIEFGPSDTLTKFARKIVGKEIKRYSVSDLASFEAVRDVLAKGEQ